MQDHYVIWGAGLTVLAGVSAVVIYDIVKNDKKLLSAAIACAQTSFQKTFKEHPWLTVIVIACGMVALGSYDYFGRGEDSLIGSLFTDEEEDEEEKESSLEVEEQNEELQGTEVPRIE
jgi:hypothetical protein